MVQLLCQNVRNVDDYMLKQEQKVQQGDFLPDKIELKDCRHYTNKFYYKKNCFEKKQQVISYFLIKNEM